MNTIIPYTERQRIRDAIVTFALQRKPTHWLTLNTHRAVSVETAKQRLKRWRVEVLRRLHGHRFYRLPEADRFEFIGAHHLTQAGEPHFHLACTVPEHVVDKFCRLAPLRWLAIVRSGTFHLDAMDDLPDSPRRMLGYALREFDARAADCFIDGRLLH